MTLPPFASKLDLEARLGEPVGNDAQAEAALADGAAYLRSLIGSPVFPQQQSTIKLRQPAGESWLQIPVTPLVSVDEVRIKTWADSAGRVVETIVQDNYVQVYGPAVVELTITHGYSEPPGDLLAWNCVLASQAMAAVDELGMLGGGGVSSVGIDDYRKTFSAGGAGVGYSLPERVEADLRARYGQSSAVIGTLG